MKIGSIDTYRAIQLRLQELLLQKAAEEFRRKVEAVPHPIINPTNKEPDKGNHIDVKV